MLKKRVEEALNAQINAEIWSAHFFLAISLHFAENGYPGFAARMKYQHQEEHRHALRLMDYVIEQGGKVELQDIVDIPSDFGDPVESFEQVLVHLMRITDTFDTLLDVVCDEKEEAEISQIIAYLKRMTNENGYYMMDLELIKKY